MLYQFSKHCIHFSNLIMSIERLQFCKHKNKYDSRIVRKKYSSLSDKNTVKQRKKDRRKRRWQRKEKENGATEMIMQFYNKDFVKCMIDSMHSDCLYDTRAHTNQNIIQKHKRKQKKLTSNQQTLSFATIVSIN